jgi:hypothetical protein
MARQKFLSLATLLVTAALGCQGTIGDAGDGTASPGTGGTGTRGTGATGGRPPITTGGAGGGVVGPGGTGGTGGTGGLPPPPPDPLAAGAMPLRRLTIREYNNTVRDLLGDSGNRANTFTLDKDSEFLFKRANIVSSSDADNLKDAAEATAAAVASRVMMMAPCAGGNEDSCATAFINDFGPRAYRRPLAADEVTRLTDLYHTGRTALGLDYPNAIQLLIEGVLQSPGFLYHWELGNNAPTVEGKVVKLSPYEVASRLSYFIWGSMPDAVLFTAAKNNQLGTQMEIQTQAQRMLKDAKARETVSEFTNEWLNLDQVTARPKDMMVYPQWTDALKAAMAAELSDFIAGTVFDGDGRFTSLLMGTNSFVNDSLGPIYGMSGITGSNMRPATLDSGERAGLLTRAGFLAVNASTDRSSPTRRGHRIFERLLCGEMPMPPANVPPSKPITAAGTTRQHIEDHDKNPCTGACHGFMDPVGFAFEHYDGIGRYRTSDNGLMVDSTGEFEVDGKMVSFNDARDVSKVLSSSTTAAQCFATQWLRYATKRTDTEADRASLEGMDAAFAKANSITDLMVGLVGSRTFRYRAPGAGEKLQ